MTCTVGNQISRTVLQKATSDKSDILFRDFDFEEIFLFDEPQKKLASVVEVSIPNRNRICQTSQFSLMLRGWLLEMR